MQNFTSGFALSAQQAAAFAAGPAATDATAQLALALSPGLDAARVREALRRTLDRHEIFRTRYVRLDALSAPLQAVGDDTRLTWIDAAGDGLDADWTALEAVPLAADEADRVFALYDPARGHLLLRCTGLHLDAASVDVLCAQLAAACTDAGAPDGEEVVQYADYAEWQRQSAPETAPGQGGADIAPALPFAWQAGDAVAAPRRRSVRTLSAQRVQALTAAAATLQVALEDLLLLAWYRTLQLHAGDVPVALAFTAPARLPELADAIGPYACRSALAPAIPGTAPLLDAARALRAAATAAAEAASFGRGAQHSLPHGFSFHRHVAAVSAGVRIAPQRVALAALPADLHLHCAVVAGDVELSFFHDGHRYGDAHIAILAEQYLALLEEVAAADPVAPLATLSAVDADAHARLLGFGEGDATVASSPDRELLLHELFLRQAALTPDAVAVCREDRRLSYRELDARSEALARRLIAHGAAPETRIGICLANPVDMIVAIVAVLRSGGVYLPLDVNYPVDRLRYMLADAGAPLLVVDDRAAGLALLDGMAVSVLALDANDDPAGAAVAAPAQPLADNGAYVIYTSGSTGRPKGVLVPHRAIVASTLAREAWYPERPSAFLLLSSFSFDSSIAGIFWTLSSGGTLVLSTPEIVHDIERLGGLIRDESVSHTLMVPSLYGTLLAGAPAGSLETLRAVIVAGEQCPQALVGRHRERLPGVSLYNEYGPTETAVWASVDRLDAGESDRVAIGRPISGARIRILDERMTPVPQGAVGEVYVGGTGVARGYLQRPDLTAERYLPDPLAPQPGARMYRTGDLARFLADGRIEYVGRIDHQVKVRGYRIELGEIEAALAAHPEVAQCAVTVHETSGEQTLYAYWTALPGAAADAMVLHEWMRERLPVHMLPQNYFRLPELPLSINGKIDRKALPHPSTLRDGGEYAAPEGAFETDLAAIWVELLGVERVGRGDNFFKLGGHSLLAMQLISRIRERFLIDVKIKLVFDDPELAPMAERLRARVEGDADAEESAELDVLEI